MSNPKRTRKEIREAIKKIKIKRKLNSKNPKYKKGEEEKLVVLKKVPFTGKAKGYGVWYKNEK
jgi:hypothetical protein